MSMASNVSGTATICDGLRCESAPEATGVNQAISMLGATAKNAAAAAPTHTEPDSR